MPERPYAPDSIPYLSVIITSFNQGKWLMEAFDSYQRHSHRCFSELIVIDDGSTSKDTLRSLDKIEDEGHM